MQDIIIQLIISGAGVIMSVVAVVGILAKKLGNNNGYNGKKADNGLQKQVDAGVDGTKTLSDRFTDQVLVCNKEWNKVSEDRGRAEERYKNIEKFMETILDKLK